MKISIRYIILLLLFLGLWLNPSFYANGKNIEVSGIVKNSKNKKPIGNASITVPTTNIGTVTNSDGRFTLKYSDKYLSQGLKIEQIGFKSYQVNENQIALNRDELTIFLEPSGKVLKEVLVIGGDPKEIVRSALNKIPENFSLHDNIFSGFYRETVQKGNRFINISEAVVDVLKKPYRLRQINGEKVRINRGRKLLSPKSSDTLAVKLMGGPYMPIMLDAVKNGDHLFNIDEIDNFDFKLCPGAMIDDRLHYEISFKPKVSLAYPLNSGVMYIDGESLTISRVEFELDMKDKNKVTRAILQKKPSGLNFKPLEVSGTVTYKTVDGKSYINYINSRIRFKCDWKKRLFSSTYTSNAEMVMVDRNDSINSYQKFKDSFGQRKIFSDLVENYWDADFWDDYNIIEPTESLEKAVEKLKRR